MKLLFTAFVASSAMIMTPVAAQSQSEHKDYPGNNHQERVAAFMADPIHADIVAKARAGDPGSMYELAEIIERTLTTSDYNSDAVLEMRMKLLAGAMSKGWAPAYLKVGRMIRRNELPEGSTLDAYNYFLSGAKLGNLESSTEAWRIARDPNICSLCRKNGDATYLDTSAGTSPKAAGQAYLTEKRKMIAEVEAVMLANHTKQHDINTESLATFYLNGIKAFKDTYNKYDLYDEWIVRPDGAKAERMLKEVAESSTADGWAALLLGLYYIEPRDSGIARNPATSIRYLERASMASDRNAADAAQFLGHELVTGKLWPKDLAKAQTMLKLAADKGHVEALYDLGLINMLGMAGQKDPHKAANYFRMAIGKGHARSATAMGQMYRDGDLGKKDPVMMNHYFSQAAELESQSKAGQSTLDRLNTLAD